MILEIDGSENQLQPCTSIKRRPATALRNLQPGRSPLFRDEWRCRARAGMVAFAGRSTRNHRKSGGPPVQDPLACLSCAVFRSVVFFCRRSLVFHRITRFATQSLPGLERQNLTRYDDRGAGDDDGGRLGYRQSKPRGHRTTSLSNIVRLVH